MGRVTQVLETRVQRDRKAHGPVSCGVWCQWFTLVGQRWLEQCAKLRMEKTFVEFLADECVAERLFRADGKLHVGNSRSVEEQLRLRLRRVVRRGHAAGGQCTVTRLMRDRDTTSDLAVYAVSSEGVESLDDASAVLSKLEVRHVSQS